MSPRAGQIVFRIVTLGVLLGALSPAGWASGAPQSATPPTSSSGKPTTVLFMCPHGAAKSVLASAYFKQLAKARGLNVRVDAAGTEPDPAVSPKVAAHLKSQGLEVPIATPRLVTSDDLTTADVVISLGCDLSGLPDPRGTLRKWDDVPGPAENFSAADEAIRQHVVDLVEELLRQQGPLRAKPE